MNELTGQGQSERRTHPEIHETETVTDPRRLAQIVLDTLDLTFNYAALHIDEDRINGLMADPQKNWGDIATLIGRATKDATELEPQITVMDQALKNLAEDQEPLPISLAGSPPRTIVDRRVVEELTKARVAEIEKKRRKEQRRQVNWTPQQRTDYNNTQRSSLLEAIQADEIRRLAQLISIMQQDTVRQYLTPVRGWGEIIGNSEYDPGLEFMVGRVATGMNQTHKYIQLGRAALQQFTQGNLPDEPTVRDVVTGGTQRVSAYLDSFGPSQSPRTT